MGGGSNESTVYRKQPRDKAILIARDWPIYFFKMERPCAMSAYI